MGCRKQARAETIEAGHLRNVQKRMQRSRIHRDRTLIAYSTTSGRLQELKNNGKDQLVIPKCGRGRL